MLPDLLLFCCVGSLLIASVALLVLRVVGRLASMRHRICIVALLTLGILPALTLLPRPVAERPALRPTMARAVPTLLPRDAPGRTPFKLPVWALWVWLAGFGVTGGSTVAGLVRLKRFSGRLELADERTTSLFESIRGTIGVANRVQLRTGDPREICCPATWGLFTHVVCLPDDAPSWPEDLLDSVIRHELAHVQRRDWLTQTCARIVSCVFWFNPFVWQLDRAIRREAEILSDRTAISTGVRPVRYAENLVALSQTLGGTARFSGLQVAMATQDVLQPRIEAVLTPQVFNRVAVARALLTCAAAILMCGSLLAIFRQTQTATPTLIPTRVPLRPAVRP